MKAELGNMIIGELEALMAKEKKKQGRDVSRVAMLYEVMATIYPIINGGEYKLSNYSITKRATDHYNIKNKATGETSAWASDSHYEAFIALCERLISGRNPMSL